MATTFKKGDVVIVNAVLPSGPVESIRMDEEGAVFYLLSWTDINGDNKHRWFAEDDLVAV